MKWNIIKETWEYKEPKFWSKCNWFHHHKNGLYFPDEQNNLCEQCHIWWTTGLNRHEKSYPPMFIGVSADNQKGVVNEPFWYIEGEAGVKRNPKYTDDGRWLNGKGVALKREKYPDE